MQTPPDPGKTLQTPWNHPEFLSEPGLREAREYFFQTHGKQSQKIAEARNATGFAKTGARRRLSKEMGDDFKMYTGSDVGKTAKEEEASRGIRGELNNLIRSVYQKIAPKTPVSSPIQEDLTVLKHPLGALEVCFGMVAYYQDLLKKYASFAANRRQVLKSVIDEELFKWVWRLYYSFTLGDKTRNLNFRENIPSIGLNFIPLDKQRLPTSDKVFEIGMFLLGSSLSGSELRFPLVYYFVCYLRQIQFRMLPLVGATNLDTLFEKLRIFKPDQATEDILVAVDALMNAKGSSMQSFDEILGDEEIQATKSLPGPETSFLSQAQEFTRQKFNESLKKFLPSPKENEEAGGQHASLMPIVMLLRTLPYPTGQVILGKIPGPFLNLMKNRLSHGHVDDVSMNMLKRIEEMIDARRKKGETYAIYSKVKGSPTPTTVRPTLSQANPLKPGPAASGTTGGPRLASPKGAAARPDSYDEENRPAPAQAPAQPGGEREVVVAWEARGTAVMVTSVSSEDIVSLTGADTRFLIPWVLFAIQTGQVFNLKPDQVSKAQIEQILRSLCETASPSPQISAEERKQLHMQFSGLSHRKALLEMMRILGIGGRKSPRGRMGQGITQIAEKAGEKLEALIKTPADPANRPLLEGLGGEGRHALSVLNRVSRAL